MVEHRNNDQASFKNFLRMPPSTFNELLARVGPDRKLLESGMKLAIILSAI